MQLKWCIQIKTAERSDCSLYQRLDLLSGQIHLYEGLLKWNGCSTVTMLILLAAIFALHIIGIILLLVATIDNAWWMTNSISTDVWGRWIQTNGVWNLTDLPEGSHYPQDYLQAVQASSVLACIFSILGIFVFLAQLFTLTKGQRFTISGIFQLLACLCIMIAASIYTDRFHIDEKDGWYGHSYILAWIAFGFTFISSITYFVLRKKTA
ncbi:epithelial membrane protein 2-like isoform X1 [Acanthopagrus latus]|uniref:epithelial membrane protein 2-like isoform X1 n=2 Tax=Acanthopagrus latus TaxID=8177 RepID=UPI00187CF5B5|nr:epithelial membrane protein 2-like isoform X1 [Acanthopagrus latus]